MTKEPIMIDGVDVSGCEYLYIDSRYNDKCCSASIGGDSLCNPSAMLCSNYVEQLKQQLDALEVENEKLKQYNASKQASYETMQIEWNEAKNKVKELKAENKNIVICYKNNLLTLNHEELVNNKLTNRCLKLEQTLLEIKEICKLAPKKTMCNSCLTFGFPPEHELIKLILHKCEV